MIFNLEFHPEALKEWHGLDQTVRAQFKKKLQERLIEPRVPSARVSGGIDLYKIKLAALGYRLVYTVIDDRVVVYVLSVGKRQGNSAYKKGLMRHPLSR